MRALMLLSAGLLIGLTGSPGSPYSCLPKGIAPTDVVSVPGGRPGPRREDDPTITVQDKLKEFGARCRKGKLVDSKGKEIYFFRMSGCWGNPPADYREILEKQDRELERLRKRYRVIEMTCNPSGEPIL